MKGQFGISIRRKSRQEDTNIHREHVPEIVGKLIEQADIILEILDARFIGKTRNYDTEKKVKELGKVLIYILNKADLIDVNLMRQNKELEELRPYMFFSCKDRKGTGTLRKMIHIQAKKLGKESVSIGVIGYPNTGKSSIINLLKRKAVARTSPEAGFTKGIQKVRLDSGLYLIDTPGIIPAGENSLLSREDLIKHSEIGVKMWDKARDPEMVIDRLLHENPGVLEKYYKIEAGGDAEVLIEQLGRKLYYLRKGNLVDSDRTARQILRDWQEGKIRIYSEVQ